MITKDDFVKEPVWANFFLGLFFKKEDLCNELAHQVLADRIFSDMKIWDNYEDKEENLRLAFTRIKRKPNKVRARRLI